MTDAAGAFHATQDADSEGEEGKYFVWSPAELEAVLGAEDGRRAATAFGVTAQGTFEHGRSVLERRVPLAELARASGASDEDTRRWLDSVRARLLAERSKRVPPGRDDKVLAGWNGLMIRGLAFAARVFERPEWAARAARAAGAVLERQWQGGRLFRVHQDGASKVDAFLEDWGGLAAGLVGALPGDVRAALARGRGRSWPTVRRSDSGTRSTGRTARRPADRRTSSSRRTRCTTTRSPRGRACSPRRTSGSPR